MQSRDARRRGVRPPIFMTETARHCGKNYFVPAGSTTPFNHGRAKSVRWETGQETARVLKVARRITHLRYLDFNKQRDQAQPNSASAPLFASVSYLEGGTHRADKHARTDAAGAIGALVAFERIACASSTYYQKNIPPRDRADQSAPHLAVEALG